MFGIGFQELLVVVFIALIAFGPRKLPQMARELGHFVSEARSAVDEFKGELSAEEVDEVQPDVEEPEVEHASGKN
jgi:Tat protein translocase TatB subunit